MVSTNTTWHPRISTRRSLFTGALMSNEATRKSSSSRLKATRDSPSRRDPPAIDPDDRHLLVFAIRWMPYGGGPADEIFIQFGMTPQRFYERLQEVIERHWSRIHPATRSQLVRVWSPQTPSASQKAADNRTTAPRKHGAA
jgi:Protein of unknown function (DUF3263)